MSSSIGVKSGLARHGRIIAFVILVQSLLIIWLSSWAIGDYSNNQYVRAYVDSTVQSLMWVLGAVTIVGVVGSVLGLVARRRRGSGLELVGAGPKIPISTRVARGSMSASRAAVSVSRTSAVSAPTVTTVSSTGVEVSAPKSAPELHPAVAALKAELSEARMSLGLASVTTGSALPAVPAPRFEDQRTPQTTQTQPQVALSPIIHRPQNSIVGQNTPPTVIRPMGPPGSSQNVTPTLFGRPSPPPTVIRPVISPTGSGPQPSALPMVKPPSPPPQSSPHPMGVPTRPETVPTAPKDVSTVITGIMPVLKKKDEAASSSDQNSQQKQ